MLSGDLMQPKNWTTCPCLTHRRAQCLNLLRHPPPHQQGATRLGSSIGSRTAPRRTPPLPLAHHQHPLPKLQILRTRERWETNAISMMALQERPRAAPKNLLRRRKRRRIGTGQKCKEKRDTGQNQHQHYVEM